jgi:hypothetical protein
MPLAVPRSSGRSADCAVGLETWNFSVKIARVIRSWFDYLHWSDQHPWRPESTLK